MPLPTGSRLGVYEVVAAIGAGGMGEVYRARDTRLNRDVAIKVLPEQFAKDPERLERFGREAQVLASLNHPHIAQIHGIEESGGTIALVMELVEGDTLAERVARGAVPLDEAIPIARQIAEALEAAHDRGIIHRDLKPANIKVRGDGTVKVLDFGLAKAMAPAGEGPLSNSPYDALNSPTITSPATQLGVILGTAAYMAPEQAKGRAIDRRADVWAFGVVLFEMLTGRRPFEGDDISEMLVSVLRDAPAFDALPPDTPEPIRRLLRRCLEKDPRERLAEMSAVRLEIRDALSGDSGTIVSAHPHRGERHGWTRISTALAILAAALAAALVWSVASRPAVRISDTPGVRFPLVTDPNLRVTKTTTQPFAVSPDGRTIVFSANAGSGVHLWVRTLDTLEPRLLAHTEGAFQPAISPNGEWVAFVVSNHVIRKVRIAGGAATTITSLDDVTASLAWVSDEEIVFEMIGSRSGIHRVRANGGPAELLIPLDRAAGEVAQRRPFVLRRERAVVYTSLTETGPTTLAMFALDGGRRSRLGVGLQALGVIDGHLLYSRDDGALMAVPFDAGGMRTLGEPRELTDRVARSGMGTAVALSPSGTLAFSPPEARVSRLLVADASGRAVAVGDLEREFERPRLSPEGGRIAVGIVDGDARDLWILDRASAELTRVTRGEDDTLVGWTSDGRALIHLRRGQIWMTAVDGSAEPRRLVAFDGTATAAAILPDGKSMVVLRVNQGIVLVSLETGKESALIASARSGRRPRPYEVRVSLDGKWIAYTDRNEQEVHVRAVDGSAGMQVSTQGGERPMWGQDGRLFYEGPGGLMTAQLQFSPALAVSSRTRLVMSSAGAVHDVSPDGKTFLILEPSTRGPGVLVALDWAGDVRRQLRIK